MYYIVPVVHNYNGYIIKKYAFLKKPYIGYKIAHDYQAEVVEVIEDENGFFTELWFESVKDER